MKRTIGILIATIGMVVACEGVAAQNTNSKKVEVKVDEMDVIYDDADFEGVIIDEKRNEERKRPNLLAPPPVLYDEIGLEDELPMQDPEDEGADSENDILYASFDSVMIHYPRKTFGPNDTVKLILTDAKHKFSFPTPHEARATSHFGPRRRRFHYGVDLAQPTGKEIYAAFDGTVRISRFNSSYGNLIVLRHDNGLETYYAHLSVRYAQPGMRVKAGDVIGLCGNTGRSYGSHLHFEVRYMGNAMNPEHVINCTTHKLVSNELCLTQNSFRKVATTTAASKASAARPSKGGAQYYKVKSGDTLGKIAARNHTTVRRLCQLNGIKETTVLSIGRKLRVK